VVMSGHPSDHRFSVGGAGVVVARGEFLLR
jgi:hypothetical protein